MNYYDDSNDEKVDVWGKDAGSLGICIYRGIQIAGIFLFFIYLNFLQNENPYCWKSWISIHEQDNNVCGSSSAFKFFLVGRITRKSLPNICTYD
jgi:hypothetical protein